MNWSALDAITAVVCGLATAACAFFSLMVRIEVAKLRAEIAQNRMQDREELRQWINGSFMRAATAQAKLETAQAKLDEMEHRLDNVEIRLSVGKAH